MATCPWCQCKTAFELSPVFVAAGGSLAGVQAKVSARLLARLTCVPLLGGCGLFLDGVVDGADLAVRESEVNRALARIRAAQAGAG